MCIQDNIQSKIAELTNDGDTIAVFLADILHSQSDPAVKTCHKLDAARLLAKYSIPQQDNITQFPSPSTVEGQDRGEENPPHPVHPVNSVPTLRDIIAYPVARYIRERTDDGDTMLEALRHIMSGGDYDPVPFSGIPQRAVKPHHRLSAAKELLRRAFAEHRPPRSASNNPPLPLGEGWGEGKDENIPSILSIDVSSHSLNSDLARLTRDKTDDGIEVAELLIRITESSTPKGDWLPAHRLSAAKELLHRAYDLNYDAVTWEHIDAYNRAMDADADDGGAELERARIRTHRAEIIREFNEAYDAADEEAMAAVQAKYDAYNLRLDEGADPDEALRYAELGPDDPDPDTDYHYEPLSEEEQAKFYREVVQLQADDESESESDSGDRSIAAQVHTPKLTIPLHNRSP